MTTLDPVRKNEELTGGSLEELRQFRETFAANLKASWTAERRFARPILMFLLAGFAAIFCSFLLFQPPAKWLFITGFVLVAIGLVWLAAAATRFQRTLICPACRNSFIDKIDGFCPECGSDSLEVQNWHGARHCNFCGKDLVSGKHRNFKYRACTHCGVMLDEKGL